jgi:hypothetical protein
MKAAIIIKAILVSIFLITLISCKNSNSEYGKKSEAIVENLIQGKELMEQKCNICHSVTSKSHDEIIAPPMVAVKRRYLRLYNSEKEFVEAVTNWVLNPNEDDALMFGAVQQFKVMPKLTYDKEEIQLIAQYIYNNKIDQPFWFQQHFNEEHQSGKGRRMGRGNGAGRRNQF